MLGLTLGGNASTPVVHTVHGPLDGEPGEIYDQISRVAPQRRADLDLDEPAQAEARSELDRQLPERARLLGLSRASRTEASTCSSSAG